MDLIILPKKKKKQEAKKKKTESPKSVIKREVFEFIKHYRLLKSDLAKKDYIHEFLTRIRYEYEPEIADEIERKIKSYLKRLEKHRKIYRKAKTKEKLVRSVRSLAKRLLVKDNIKL